MHGHFALYLVTICVSLGVLVSRSALAERHMFLPVPFIGWLVGLDPKFLDNGAQSSLNGSPENLHTSLTWGQALKSTFKKILPMHSYKISRGKTTSNSAGISPTAVNRKRVTAQHIDKQKYIFRLR